MYATYQKILVAIFFLSCDTQPSPLCGFTSYSFFARTGAEKNFYACIELFKRFFFWLACFFKVLIYNHHCCVGLRPCWLEHDNIFALGVLHKTFTRTFFVPTSISPENLKSIW